MLAMEGHVRSIVLSVSSYWLEAAESGRIGRDQQRRGLGSGVGEHWAGWRDFPPLLELPWRWSGRRRRKGRMRRMIGRMRGRTRGRWRWRRR